MKFQVASSILLSLVSAAAGQYDTTIPSPVCAKLKQFTVEGVGEFVDTDGSGVFPQTTGDMSISFNLSGKTALGQYPNQSLFKQISLDMNAVCVVKRDQIGPSFDAPVCLYEAEMSFCRNYILFPIDIEVQKVSREEVLDVGAILEKNGLTGGRRTQSIRGSQATIVGDKPELEDGDRKLQREPLFSDKDELVEAVKVTDEVMKLDRDLINLLCPQLGCLIPLLFCKDKREGGFTAHGTGSQDIKITGGTAGLFGAFGQIITPASGISILSVAGNGDITYEFDVELEICYYRRESGFW